MADGSDRARRHGGADVHQSSVDDLLARHGDTSGPHAGGGRAARRRAAEERERQENGTAAGYPAPPAPRDPPNAGRHSTPTADHPGGGHRAPRVDRSVDSWAPDPRPAPQNGHPPAPWAPTGQPPTPGPDSWTPTGRPPAPGPDAPSRTPTGQPGSGPAPWTPNGHPPPNVPSRAPGSWTPDGHPEAPGPAPWTPDGDRQPGPDAEPPAGGRPWAPGTPGPLPPRPSDAATGRRARRDEPAAGDPAPTPAQPQAAGRRARRDEPAGPQTPGRHTPPEAWSPSEGPSAERATERQPPPPPGSLPPHAGPGPRPPYPDQARPPAPPNGHGPPRTGYGPATSGAPPAPRNGTGPNASATAFIQPPHRPAPPPAAPWAPAPLGPTPVGPAAYTPDPAATAVHPAGPRPSPDAPSTWSPGPNAADPTAATTALRPTPPSTAPDATAMVRPQAPAKPDAKPDAEPEDDAGTRITPGTRHTPSKEDREVEAGRIDQSLIRMTAAHAGLELSDPGESLKSRPADDPGDTPDDAVPISRGRRAGRLAVRLAVAAVTLAVLAAGGVGWGAKTWLDTGVRDAAALDPASNAILDPAAQQGDQNVLIVASDRSRDPAVRADTVVVAHIPDGGGPVTVLSLPHNLEIDRPACDRWDPATAAYSSEPEPAEANAQLVSAIDRGGPRCVTNVVQQLTGLAVTQYVGLDLGAVEDLSAAAKGVDVCVPAPVVDEALGTIVAEPGPVITLDGVRAGDYVRARAVQGEPAAELGRIERQQKFLAGMLDSMLFEPALLDIDRVTRMRPALREALLLDGGGLDGALAVSTSLRRLDADGVTFAAVPTTGGTDGVGNAVLRDADAAALFAAVRQDQPLPAQADDLLAATAGPAPADLRVQLLNATERPGLAEEIGGTLGQLGFGIGQVGNAAQPTNETIIKFSPDQAAGAELLGASIPSATRVPDPGSTGVLQLVLGRSFDDVLRPPTAPLTPVTDPAAAVPTAGVPRTNCP